jgi:hypothetical protein
MAKVIIGRVGMSVLMFQTETHSHPYTVAEGTKIYSLSNFLCFCRHAPGELHKTQQAVQVAKLQELVEQANLTVAMPAGTPVSFAPCAAVVASDVFYTYIGDIVNTLTNPPKETIVEAKEKEFFLFKSRLSIGPWKLQKNSFTYAATANKMTGDKVVLELTTTGTEINTYMPSVETLLAL